MALWRILRNDALEVAAQILRRHSLTTHQVDLDGSIRPWKSGSFSDVYLLKDPAQLLRITATDAEHSETVGNIREVARLSHGLTPRLFFLRTHPVVRNDGERFIVVESVIERLQAIPFGQWWQKFKTPNALVRALMETGRQLFQRHIVHRDISHGNVLLTPAGFRFIDADDACIYPHGSTCTLGTSSGTPGYPLPERDGIAGDYTPFIVFHYLAKSKEFTGRSNGYSSTPLAQLHNMVHALLLLGLSSAFGYSMASSFLLAVHRRQVQLPPNWLALLEHASTMDVSDRFDFDSVVPELARLEPLEWNKSGAAVRRVARRRRTGVKTF